MTFTVVDKGQATPSPVSGTVKKAGLVMSVQIPTDTNGKLLAGGIVAQTREAFSKLAKDMEAAGGSLADVMFVTVYLTDKSDWQVMHDVWCATFAAPFPGRATVGVKELMLEGMLIEIVAQGHIG